MRLRKFSQGTIIAGCAALLCAAPLFAAQAPASSGQTDQTADRLLQEVKANAQTIESHAQEIERLSKDSTASWFQFDQQWNEIKPAQEQLQARIWRLEAMNSSLSGQQRQDLNACKQAAAQISERTRQLVNAMDRPGVSMNAPAFRSSTGFRSEAQSLAEDARTVAGNA